MAVGPRCFVRIGGRRVHPGSAGAAAAASGSGRSRTCAAGARPGSCARARGTAASGCGRLGRPGRSAPARLSRTLATDVRSPRGPRGRPGRRPPGRGRTGRLARQADERMANLLLVDDDADLVKLLSMRLGAAGHRVTAVESAEAALTQLAVARPQLVVSDVRLPGRDGLMLFDEIRARYPALPGILLTAHGTIPDAVEATSRGVFSYLTKPFDGKALLDIIANALAVEGAAESATDGGEVEAWRSEIVSRSNRMAEVLAEAKLVAASDASVLIRGE